ncbi:hypothetical protein M426DRAFT_264842 [Hypoxylon sp. CI-4A]|nr:hypothetical protein M426DRAFT_264842 [Hypoxylon sp. CI-4A]
MAESSHEVASNEQQTLIQVQDVPGKGKGVIAQRDIAIGTCVLYEKPLIMIDSSTSEVPEKIIAAMLKDLPKERQRQYLSLHNNFPGRYPFSGIARTNCLGIGQGSRIGAAYPTISRINHSCVPNVHPSWNIDDEMGAAYAVRPIKEGDEITIDFSTGGPSIVRQERLYREYGFHCNCELCSLPPDDLELSDSRHFEIERLYNAMGGIYRASEDASAALSDHRFLIKCLEGEYLEGAVLYTTRVYLDAFKICSGHGDQARACAFAERAHRARLVFEGEDSLFAEHTKALMEDPTSHSLFASYSTDWEDSDKFPPTSLDEADFEEWLWKRAN